MLRFCCLGSGSEGNALVIEVIDGLWPTRVLVDNGFNLRQLKGRLEEFEAGDLSPEAVATIADELGVPGKDVVEMNRRMTGADGSLNETMLADGDAEWLDRLVDERPSQEAVLAEADEMAQRRKLSAS